MPDIVPIRVTRDKLVAVFRGDMTLVRAFELLLRTATEDSPAATGEALIAAQAAQGTADDAVARADAAQATGDEALAIGSAAALRGEALTLGVLGPRQIVPPPPVIPTVIALEDARQVIGARIFSRR